MLQRRRIRQPGIAIEQDRSAETSNQRGTFPHEEIGRRHQRKDGSEEEEATSEGRQTGKGRRRVTEEEEK